MRRISSLIAGDVGDLRGREPCWNHLTAAPFPGDTVLMPATISGPPASEVPVRPPFGPTVGVGCDTSDVTSGDGPHRIDDICG